MVMVAVVTVVVVRVAVAEMAAEGGDYHQTSVFLSTVLCLPLSPAKLSLFSTDQKVGVAHRPHLEA